MSKKVVAIGNRMMGDDAIGIEVADNLQGFFLQIGFEVIIGETDVEYCLNYIDTGDFLIILDACFSGLEPGSISIMPIEELGKSRRRWSTQHEPNLLQWLHMYRIEVKGVLIAIEVCKVELSWGLSELMKRNLPLICERIKDEIRLFLEEGYDA